MNGSTRYEHRQVVHLYEGPGVQYKVKIFENPNGYSATFSTSLEGASVGAENLRGLAKMLLNAADELESVRAGD